MSAEAGHRALKAVRRALAEMVGAGTKRDDPSHQEALAIIVALVKTYGDPDPPRRKPISERPSMPPVLEANRATRATADAHFKAARRILEDIK